MSIAARSGETESERREKESRRVVNPGAGLKERKC